MITDLVTFIYVKDLERSADFYSRVMGLGLRLDQGSCRIYEVVPGACLGVCVRKGKGKNRTGKEGIILTLVTAAVDEWYERMKREGVDILQPPAMNEEYKIYHFFLLDPDGYKVEIQQFLDPNWVAEGAPG